MATELNASVCATDRALTRSAVYSALAKGFRYPTEALFASLESGRLKDAVMEWLVLEPSNAELQEQGDALVAACDFWWSSERRKELEAEHNRLFAHLGSAQCPPYETEYGYNNIFQKTEAMADIAGFYGAYGLEPASTDTERVDFICTELEFMAYLALHEAYAREHGEAEHLDVCLDTQRKFLRDHLGRWTPVFAGILDHATSNTFYRRLGQVLRSFIESEVHAAGVTPATVTAPDTARRAEIKPFGCDACIAQARLNEVKEQQGHADG